MITFFYKPNRETIENIKRNKLFNECRIDVMEVDIYPFRDKTYMETAIEIEFLESW